MLSVYNQHFANYIVIKAFFRRQIPQLENTFTEVTVTLLLAIFLCLQVAQLWQRDRAISAILRGRIILRLNFRLNGYVSRQYLISMDR